MNDLCASVQKTIIEILMNKLEKAAKDLNIKEVAIAGGVSANSALRKAMQTIMKNWAGIFISRNLNILQIMQR
jgi:tRNA A37 threonylcarbamoyltransferase TsaD